MKSYYKLFFTLTFLYSFFLSSSQESILLEQEEIANCPTTLSLLEDSPNAEGYRQAFNEINSIIENTPSDSNLRITRAVQTLPVVFHVIHNSSDAVGTGTNIADNFIYAQIEQLNLDFRKANANLNTVPSEFMPYTADMQVEFCLAQQDPNGNPTTGINRYTYNNTEFTDEFIDTTIKPNTIWDRDKYINIWVIPNITIAGISGTLLGYATFPGGSSTVDGVVLRDTTVGSVANPNPANLNWSIGRTATHELGHYFALYHVWGTELSSCEDTDYITDTPNQEKGYAHSPTHPQTSCGSNDMFMNYMDYVNGDIMAMFTHGQKERLDAVLAGPRAGLLTSDACNAVNDYELSANQTEYEICEGESVTIPLSLTYTGNYSGTTTISENDLPNTATVNFSQATFNNSGNFDLNVSNLLAGKYLVRLNAENQGGSISKHEDIFIHVLTNFTSSVTLTLPENNATNTGDSIDFLWTGNDNATEYKFELAEDSNFNSIIYTQTTAETTINYNFSRGNTTYYWRVTPINKCATGSPSTVYQLTTGDIDACKNLISNGGFESVTSGLIPYNWLYNPAPQVSTDSFTGNYAIEMTASNDNYMILLQEQLVPTTDVITTLKFTYKVNSTETNNRNDELSIITLPTGGGNITFIDPYTIDVTASNSGTYKTHCVDVSSYAGQQNIAIGFFFRNNGSRPSSVLIDDVELITCNDTIQLDIPSDTNEYTADYEYTDTNNWTHYISKNSSCNPEEYLLLLSVKKDGENIGTVGDGTFEMKLTANPTTSTIQPPHSDNQDAYLMNRYWTLKPTTEPSKALEVAHYYTNEGLNALYQATNNTASSPQEIYFWKINDIAKTYDNNPINGHTDVPTASSNERDGIWKFYYGTPSLTNFGHSMYKPKNTEYHQINYVVSHFGGGGGGTDRIALLPLELVSFNGTNHNNTNKLKWQATQAINVSHFEVEHSTNGQLFHTITEVNAHNSTSLQEYSYSHETITNQNYYRLKIVDFNGNFEYSNIILINSDIDVNNSIAYSQATHTLNVLMNTEEAQRANWQIITMQGKIVASNSIELTQGMNQFTVDTNRFGTGKYIFISTVNGKTTSKSFIKH